MNTLKFYFLAAVIAACSSIKASYDYDKQADFSNYKTYAYSEGTLKLPVQELNRNRVLEAIDHEMSARGFSKSDNPDVLLDLHVKTEQKRDATATTTGAGMYRPWAYGYGGGFTTTQIDVNDYIEGTLFINMVDKASDKLVWQGRGTKVIDEDASAEKREANINKGIASIFENYPPKGK